MSDIYINPKYLEHLKDDHRVQIFYGGSSSGKSFFLGQRIVLDILDGKRNYLVVRNVLASIRRSTFNEIVKAIYDMEVQQYFKINNTEFSITCTLNNKQIIFAGCDNVEKLKSITPINGVITDVFMEEATEISYNSYKQLRKRLRGKSEVKKRITLAFNPILRTHWIYEEFFKEIWTDDMDFYEDEEMMILKTTYKDNAFLEEDDINELENEKDPYFYEVYTLGNFGVLGNVIFKNWRVEDLTDRIPTFDNVSNGLDFGWSNPNAFIRAHVDRERKKIYIFGEMYQRHQTAESLANDLREVLGNQYVTCDSEDPRSISEISRLGIHAIKAKKGVDSVIFGIKWLQKFELIIDVHCQNFKNEIQAYHWQEDREGNAIERPVKKDDHLLDALRYALEGEMLVNEVKASTRL